ncbi:MAG: SiaB family protein kinase [Bacteroidales bacterium]|nr:SiaB family protein kinase [Bacteroidales bacterium]MCF8390099.1 SiaB family protein kinase [Bacteroidales bacterium]
MQKPENIIEYKGHLTFNTIGRLLTILKQNMAEKGIELFFYKRMLSVMIEVLENIYKYADQYQNNPYISKNIIPTFRIDRIGDTYQISSTNPIKIKDSVLLRKKIDRINKTTETGLKLLYRQTISNGKFTEKGGAGLGLIEMAKISGNPIQYQFDPINDEFSLYTLKVLFT